jgi:lambda family phage portal protein
MANFLLKAGRAVTAATFGGIAGAFHGGAYAFRAAMAVHAAADRGRRNRDWPVRQVSADAETIPDLQPLVARSRGLVRDSALGRSAVGAFVRNIAGRGIAPVPTIKGPAGEELDSLNEFIEARFWRWASSKRHCDVQRRRTFWQQQRLWVRERFTAGSVFVVWSYKRGVGLQLQTFEVEQLDFTKQSHEGREVRAGVEVDEYGAPVAYWFYPKPLNDYRGVAQYESKRIKADRVLQYDDPDRVLQTVGRPELVAVMQDIRDDNRWKDASLWTRIIQSCIGLIRKNPPGLPGGPIGLPKSGGDDETTTQGDQIADFAPGMVYDAPPGGDLTPFAPAQQAGDFDAFTTSMHRRIGAGARLSYGQLTRDFTKGTYSGQRQEMLEDHKEFEPEEDNLIDSLLTPIYALWLWCEVMEQKVPIQIDDFKANRERYTDAEYPLNAKPWINPKDEAEGIEKLVGMGVATRTEFTSSRGGRFRRNIRTLSGEQKLAAQAGVTLTGVEPTVPAVAPVPPPVSPPPAQS